MSDQINPTPWLVDWSDFSIRDAKGQLIAHLARQPDGAHVANGKAILRAVNPPDEVTPTHHAYADCPEPNKHHLASHRRK